MIRHHGLVAVVLPMLIMGCQIDTQGWDLLLLRSWPPPESSPADVGLAFEDLRIPTADGRELAAWFVPALSGNPRGTVLFHTGAEGNIGRYLSTLPWAAESDFNLLIYDYQGFGASDGEPNFRNFEPDAHAVVNYLLSRPEPSAHVLIHLGGSLGSLPALSTAAAYPDETVGVVIYGGFFPEQVGGLWLETFVCPLLAPLGYLSGLVWAGNLPDFVNPHIAIPHIQDPFFVVIPEDDTIVPVEAQTNFFAALPEPKELYWAQGDHSPNAIEDDPGMGIAILQWANQLDGLLPAEP